MTITTTTLFRVAGVAAMLAGLIFIGVQINHPYLDATSITTIDVMARNSLKMLMAALALAGITGVYPAPGARDRRARPRWVRLVRRRLPKHAGNRIRRRACSSIRRAQCNRL